MHFLKIAFYSHRPKKNILLNIALYLSILLANVFPGVVLCQNAPPDGWQEEDIFVDTTTEPQPSQLDIKSGFIPYSRDYLSPLYINSRPKKGEITDVFKVTLAKGEYEPFVVCLYALEDIKNIQLEIKEVTSETSVLAPNQFEIRKIENRAILPEGLKKGGKRYRLIPSLLKPTDSGGLKRGKTTSFWITVNALPDSISGNYNGEIVLSSFGKITRKLKLHISILPFVLEEIPNKTFAILYTPISLSHMIRRNARILLKDMRTHGMTAYSPIVSAHGQPLEFDTNGLPKVENILQHLQWAAEEDFWRPTLLNFQKVIRAGRPNLDADYTKFEERVDIPNLTKFVSYIESVKSKYNWPEIIYLPIDEPGSFTDKAGTRREELAVFLLKTLQEQNVRGATTVADMVDNKHRRLPRWKNVVGWWDKIKPYCQVRIYMNGYPEGETSLENEIKDANTRGHEVWLYENSSTMGIDPRVSRMYFGFYGWRTGVKGITSWTHPTFDGATVNHAWASSEEKASVRQGYYSNKAWQLPPSTVCWEMVREGIDDAKYLYTLEKLMNNPNTPKDKYLNLKRYLKRAVDSTKMSKKKPECNWNGRQFHNFRNRLIEAILDLKASI
jgi:hypothetical protein